MSACALAEFVIPVKNEQRDLPGNLARLIEYLRDGFPCAWQVTIADNGSTDGTWSLAQELVAAHPGQVRALHMDRSGRGRALHTVWSASDAEIVAYMDVDLSTDLNSVLPLIAPLLAGEADVAIGTRLAPGAHVVRGVVRGAISRGYNQLLRFTLGAGFSDAQCGFKALRAEAAQQLLPLVEDHGWFFDTELLVLAQRCGLAIAEVPVDWTDSPGSLDSRVKIVSTALADLRGIWRIKRGLLTGRLKLPPLGRSPGPLCLEQPLASGAA